MSINQTTVCDSCGAEHHAEAPRGPGPLGMLLDGHSGRPVGWSRVALNGSRHIDPKKPTVQSPEEEAMDQMFKAMDSVKKDMPKEARKFFKMLRQVMQRMTSAPRAAHEHFDDTWDLCGACTDKLREFLKTMDLKQELLVPRVASDILASGGSAQAAGMPDMMPPGMGRTLEDFGLDEPGETGDAGSDG